MPVRCLWIREPGHRVERFQSQLFGRGTFGRHRPLVGVHGREGLLSGWGAGGGGGGACEVVSSFCKRRMSAWGGARALCHQPQGEGLDTIARDAERHLTDLGCQPRWTCSRCGSSGTATPPRRTLVIAQMVGQLGVQSTVKTALIRPGMTPRRGQLLRITGTSPRQRLVQRVRAGHLRSDISTARALYTLGRVSHLVLSEGPVAHTEGLTRPL